MNDIRKYIEADRSLIDTELPPSGSMERFMSKAEKKRRSKIIRLGFSGAAAMILLCLVAGRSGNLENNVMEHWVSDLTAKESEIIRIVSDTRPEDMEMVANTIRIITSETVPLAEILPEEMGRKEKIEVMRSYYRQMLEALDNIMEYYNNEQ